MRLHQISSVVAGAHVWLCLALLRHAYATIDNTAVAEILQVQADKVQGTFLIHNPESSTWLRHDSNSLNLWPVLSPSEATPINLEPYGNGTRYVVISAADCCLSAQWDIKYDNGSNWAAVCYDCQLDDPKSILRPAKQLWLFVPVPAQPESYYIIPTDHLYDMATRAMTASTRLTQSRFKSIALEKLHYASSKQQWTLRPLVLESTHPWKSESATSANPKTTENAAEAVQSHDPKQPQAQRSAVGTPSGDLAPRIAADSVTANSRSLKLSSSDCPMKSFDALIGTAFLILYFVVHSCL